MNKSNFELHEKIDLQEKILENQSKLYDYAIKRRNMDSRVSMWSETKSTF